MISEHLAFITITIAATITNNHPFISNHQPHQTESRPVIKLLVTQVTRLSSWSWFGATGPIWVRRANHMSRAKPI